MSRSRSRTIALAITAPFPAIDLRAWTLRIAATLFCLTGALVLTASRIETTKLRYELTGLHKQHQQLQGDVGRLEMELANLARPERMAKLARNMGLVNPRSHQVIVMDE